MNGSSTSLELRIDWIDIDLLGHVNNLAILRYVQIARVLHLETIGLMPIQSANGTGPILASVNCQFRKPLFYPGNVTVLSRVEEVKNTSFRIRHEIRNDSDEIAAEAQDIIVLIDFGTNTKLTLPDDLRKRLEGLECAERSQALAE